MEIENDTLIDREVWFNAYDDKLTLHATEGTADIAYAVEFASSFGRKKRVAKFKITIRYRIGEGL